jgi:hydrogenase maturation protease
LRTLVIGLGNPIVTDDGAGIKVVQALQQKVRDPNVVMVEASVGGLDLLDLIVGYDRLILVDTIRTLNGTPGRILKLGLDDLDSTSHLSSPHDIGFKEAIGIGKRLGLDVPKQVFIYAIEPQNITTFGEQCTPKVSKVIPQLVDLIIEEQFGAYSG